MNEPRVDFRSFALNVYRGEGVSDATVLLQDRCAVDVNVLLLAAFVSSTQGRTFTIDDARSAHQRVEQWQQVVVQPIRTIRRQLKYGPSPAPSPATTALRESIKQIELDAEMIELDELAEVAAGLGGPAATGDPSVRASAALRVVVTDRAGREPTAEEHCAIETIAAAAIHYEGGST